VRRHQLLLLLDVVGLDRRREDGEARLAWMVRRSEIVDLGGLWLEG